MPNHHQLLQPVKMLASFAAPVTASNFDSAATTNPYQVVELADLRSYAFTYMLRGFGRAANNPEPRSSPA